MAEHMNTVLKLPDAQPLYEQVRELLFQRIQSGQWGPGMALPNEFQLAAELGVSQGTVRKALGVLADEQLVVRRQGRGTFVAEHTPADILFRFFQFYDEHGERVRPESRNRQTRRGKAKRDEAARLGLDKDARVIRHRRERTVHGVPFILEAVVLPEARFAGLGSDAEIPNTLYDLFQKEYGVTVGRADEKLTVTAAGASEATALNVGVGQPLLKIDRLTRAIDEQPIEWRVSLCHLDNLHYAVRLR